MSKLRELFDCHIEAWVHTLSDRRQVPRGRPWFFADNVLAGTIYDKLRPTYTMPPRGIHIFVRFWHKQNRADLIRVGAPVDYANGAGDFEFSVIDARPRAPKKKLRVHVRYDADLNEFVRRINLWNQAYQLDRIVQDCDTQDLVEHFTFLVTRDGERVHADSNRDAICGTTGIPDLFDHCGGLLFMTWEAPSVLIFCPERLQQLIDSSSDDSTGEQSTRIRMKLPMQHAPVRKQGPQGESCMILHIPYKFMDGPGRYTFVSERETVDQLLDRIMEGEQPSRGWTYWISFKGQKLLGSDTIREAGIRERDSVLVIGAKISVPRSLADGPTERFLDLWEKEETASGSFGGPRTSLIFLRSATSDAKTTISVDPLVWHHGVLIDFVEKGLRQISDDEPSTSCVSLALQHDLTAFVWGRHGIETPSEVPISAWVMVINAFELAGRVDVHTLRRLLTISFSPRRDQSNSLGVHGRTGNGSNRPCELFPGRRIDLATFSARTGCRTCTKCVPSYFRIGGFDAAICSLEDDPSYHHGQAHESGLDYEVKLWAQHTDKHGLPSCSRDWTLAYAADSPTLREATQGRGPDDGGMIRELLTLYLFRTARKPVDGLMTDEDDCTPDSEEEQALCPLEAIYCGNRLKLEGGNGASDVLSGGKANGGSRIAAPGALSTRACAVVGNDDKENGAFGFTIKDATRNEETVTHCLSLDGQQTLGDLTNLIHARRNVVGAAAATRDALPTDLNLENARGFVLQRTNGKGGWRDSTTIAKVHNFTDGMLWLRKQHRVLANTHVAVNKDSRLAVSVGSPVLAHPLEPATVFVFDGPIVPQPYMEEHENWFEFQVIRTLGVFPLYQLWRGLQEYFSSAFAIAQAKDFPRFLSHYRKAVVGFTTIRGEAIGPGVCWDGLSGARGYEIWIKRDSSRVSEQQEELQKMLADNERLFHVFDEPEDGGGPAAATVDPPPAPQERKGQPAAPWVPGRQGTNARQLCL